MNRAERDQVGDFTPARPRMRRGERARAAALPVLALLLVGLVFLAVDLAIALPPLTAPKVLLLLVVALMPAAAWQAPRVTAAAYLPVVAGTVYFQVGITLSTLSLLVVVAVVVIRGRPWWAVGMSTLMLLSPAVTEPWVHWGLDLFDVVVRLFLLLLALGIGGYLHRQHRIVTALREQRNAQREALIVDLHDTVVSSLTKLVTRAEVLMLGSDLDQESARHAGSIADAGRDSLSDLRRLLSELDVPEDSVTPAGRFVPDGLAQQPESLVSGQHLVRAQAQQLEREGFEIRLHLSGTGDLTREQTNALDAVLQEGSTNILKYAAPDGVVELDTYDHLDSTTGRTCFRVRLRNRKAEPQGNAQANPQVNPTSSGFGLRFLARRVGEVGGSLVVEQDRHTFSLQASFPVGEST